MKTFRKELQHNRIRVERIVLIGSEFLAVPLYSSVYYRNRPHALICLRCFKYVYTLRRWVLQFQEYIITLFENLEKNHKYITISGLVHQYRGISPQVGVLFVLCVASAFFYVAWSTKTVHVPSDATVVTHWPVGSWPNISPRSQWRR